MNFNINLWAIFVLQKDPAIEKFGWIRENTDKFFKFKPRSVRNAVICCLLVPAAVLYICKAQVIPTPCFRWSYVSKFIYSVTHNCITWDPLMTPIWISVWQKVLYVSKSSENLQELEAKKFQCGRLQPADQILHTEMDNKEHLFAFFPGL